MLSECNTAKAVQVGTAKRNTVRLRGCAHMNVYTYTYTHIYTRT